MRGCKPKGLTPTGEAGSIAAPSYLRAKEKRVWAEVMDSPAGASISPSDVRLLVAYCRAVCMDDRITKAIDALDSCESATSQGMRVNPLITESRQQRALIRQLASELGLSPVSRRAVSAVPRTKKDPDAEFMDSL